MQEQASEEWAHGKKFYDLITERGGRVILRAIEAPPYEWDSPQAVFEAVYEQERKVTDLIKVLMEIALKERDHATSIFFQGFVPERVEDEESANDVIQKIKLMGDARGALFMLDRELGQRTDAPTEEE